MSFSAWSLVLRAISNYLFMNITFRFLYEYKDMVHGWISFCCGFFVIFFYFYFQFPSYNFCSFTHAFRKTLALIILVQRLHSIITYVGCNSSIKKYTRNTLTQASKNGRKPYLFPQKKFVSVFYAITIINTIYYFKPTNFNYA